MGFVISTPGAKAAAEHLGFAFDRNGQEANRAKMLAHLRNLEADPGKFASQTPVLVQLLTELKFFQNFKVSEHAQKFMLWLNYLRKAWQANPGKALAYSKIGAFLREKIAETPYRDIVFDWEEIADRDCPTASLSLTQTGAWKITAYTVPLDKIGPPGKPMAAGAAAKRLMSRKPVAKKAAKKKAAAPKRVAKKPAAKKKAAKKAAKRRR